MRIKHAKTAREHAGMAHDAHAAAGDHAERAHRMGLEVAQHDHERRSAMAGQVIDTLAAVSGAHRDMAAARKDHATAGQIDRTPVVPPKQQ
jgi:hypothetical protein